MTVGFQLYGLARIALVSTSPQSLPDPVMPAPATVVAPGVEACGSRALRDAMAPLLADPSQDVSAAAETSSTSPDGQDEAEAIVVTAEPRYLRNDPLKAINQQSYALTQAADRAVVQPISSVYQKILPAKPRAMIRNFFSNLGEPVVFLNYLLQLKPGKAVETAGRFVVNSTIGVAGLMDVAKRKPFGLPRRINGFANTLGYYGVKSGPFLFVPLIGPTTVRDLFGLTIDRMVLPTSVGAPFTQSAFTVPATISGSLDYRIEFDTQLRTFAKTPNPYAAARRHYLEGRKAEIDALRGSGAARPVDRRTLPVIP